MTQRPLEEILADFDEKAPLERARTIPGSWYTDDRIAELERKHVFGRTWQLVGRESQLAEPGRYLTAEVAGEPIVVVRGHDGVLRGFFNVCRHHAAAVMTECEGRADRMRCPYHGWTYALDGKLVSTTELEGVQGFDYAGMGLVPISVGIWEGLVFVHLDQRAAGLDPLDGWLGDRLRGEVAALELGKLHYAGQRQWEIACNWKVFVDNYLDGGYHIPFLHRGLSSILSFKEYTIECWDRVCLQSSPVEAGPHGDAMTASVRKGTARYYWLYPNLMLNWYEGYLDTNLVLPLGTDRVRVVFDFWFADTGGAARERNLASMNVSERIQDEDHAICESVQRGLRSQAYDAGRLSVRREAGENLFHRLLAADLRDVSRSLLRKRAPVL